jgi:hypothetical protein
VLIQIVGRHCCFLEADSTRANVLTVTAPELLATRLNYVLFIGGVWLRA